MRQVLLLLAALNLAPVSPAHAAEAPDAELLRLREEMGALAAKNQWKGVDRLYLKVVQEGLGAKAADHLMGSQAASNLGEPLVAVERLEALLAAESTVEDIPSREKARALLDDIYARYGKVEIVVGEKRLPGLVRFELPFGTEERDAIQRAREVILEERTYRGLLPLGSYMLDGEKFEVVASETWQKVTVQ